LLHLTSVNYRRLLRISKEGFWVAFGQIMAVIGLLLTVRLLTELLDPVKYGKLTLVLTIASLINLTLFGPLCNGVIRFYSESIEKNDLKGYLGSVWQIGLWVTGVVFIFGFCTGVGLMFTGYGAWVNLIILVLSFALISGYSSVLNGTHISSRRQSLVAIHQIMDVWGRLFFVGCLMILLGASIKVALVGYLLAAIIVLVSHSIFLYRSTLGAVSKSNQKHNWQQSILKYSWPFCTWGILLWAYTSVGRWSLQQFSSAEDVGYYAVLFQLGYLPFSLLSGAVSQFLAPIYFQRADKESDLNGLLGVFLIAWRMMLFSVLGTLFCAFGMSFIHEGVFGILIASAYAPASNLLPIMMLAGGFLVSAQFGTLALHTQKTTNLLVLPKNISYGAGACLAFFGAYHYNLAGVVYSMVLASITHFLWIAFIVRRQMNFLVKE